jgi:hypothetical protein
MFRNKADYHKFKEVMTMYRHAYCRMPLIFPQANQYFLYYLNLLKSYEQQDSSFTDYFDKITDLELIQYIAITEDTNPTENPKINEKGLWHYRRSYVSCEGHLYRVENKKVKHEVSYKKRDLELERIRTLSIDDVSDWDGYLHNFFDKREWPIYGNSFFLEFSIMLELLCLIPKLSSSHRFRFNIEWADYFLQTLDGENQVLKRKLIEKYKFNPFHYQDYL